MLNFVANIPKVGCLIFIVTIKFTFMRNATLFSSLVLLLVFPSACSVEEKVKPISPVASTENALILSGFSRDLGLNLEITPAFMARKDVVKFEMENLMRPNVEALIAVGKEGISKYQIDPGLISTDPNDPQFALMAVLIHQLEAIYAAGYKVVLVDGPVVDDIIWGDTATLVFQEAYPVLTN